MRGVLITKVTDIFVKKGSTICTILGIGCVFGGGVMLSRGAMKVQAAVNDRAIDIERIKKAFEDKEIVVDATGNEHEYSEDDMKNDIAATQKATKRTIIKNIAPGAGMLLMGVGFIVTGKVIDQKTITRQSKQIAGLAGYSATQEAIIQRLYKHIEETEGKEQADLLVAGVHKEKVEGPDGVSLEERLVRDLDIPEDGCLRITFDSSCKGWVNNRDYNLDHFAHEVSNLNDLLAIRGFALVEDLKDSFGIDISGRYGWDNIVGWVTSESDHVDVEVLDDDRMNPDLVILVKGSVVLNKIDDARKKSLEAYRMKYLV